MQTVSVVCNTSVYHPLLRKQIPLAIMEAVSEDSENIALFWTLFNQIVQKYTGNKNYKFNPTGFCTDMAGANFSGITKIFGDEVKSAIKLRVANFTSKSSEIKGKQIK